MQKTNFAFEILIHDDCSSDGTTEIIKQYAELYPDVIIPMYEKENQYQQGKPAGTAVWNLPRARGKYIALCEGDDYWVDILKLQKQVDILERYDDYAMCYTGGYILNGEKLIASLNNDVGDVTLEQLLYNNFILTNSVVLRTNVYIEAYKRIHSYKQNWLMGDYPLWLEIAANAKIYFLQDRTCVYRVLEESASHSSDLNKIDRFYRSAMNIRLFYAEKYSYCHLKHFIVAQYHEKMYEKYLLKKNYNSIHSEYFSNMDKFYSNKHYLLHIVSKSIILQCIYAFYIRSNFLREFRRCIYSLTH